MLNILGFHLKLSYLLNKVEASFIQEVKLKKKFCFLKTVI